MKFLVERTPGPAWERSRPRREQPGWDAHAAFMDGLVEQGVVLMGGPAGDGEDDPAVTVCEAADESAVHDLLAADPWSPEMLVTTSVRPWHIWLRPGDG